MAVLEDPFDPVEAVRVWLVSSVTLDSAVLKLLGSAAADSAVEGREIEIPKEAALLIKSSSHLSVLSALVCNT